MPVPEKDLFAHVPILFVMSGLEGNKSLWFNYPVWVILSGRLKEAAQGPGHSSVSAVLATQA